MSNIFQERFRYARVPYVSGHRIDAAVAAHARSREPLFQVLLRDLGGIVVVLRAIGPGKVNAAKHRYTPGVSGFLTLFATIHQGASTRPRHWFFPILSRMGGRSK